MPHLTGTFSSFRAAVRLPLLLYRFVRWRAYRGGWLPGYLARPGFRLSAIPPGRPVDVMVLVSDHFEPPQNRGEQAAAEAVRFWCSDYERLAEGLRDSDGRPPQHTWFYPFEFLSPGCLHALSECAFRGFGEVEFHLHHGHDTHASFAESLRAGLALAHRHGAMLTAEASPRARFGYVAGNSALDNGAGDDALSGCNTELAALAEAGCYADFTFPCLGSPAQPRRTNSIYYAREDGRPKSYDDGTPLRVGGSPSGDLTMFQGPVAFNWEDGFVDDGSVEDSSPASPRRLNTWLSAHVHVEGRPEWAFVKLTTHGMQNRASFLGRAMRDTFAAMQMRWTRPPFRLHYVTAREAYNIAKAAEAGHWGDPNDYRDFLVPPPANRLYGCSGPWQLLSHGPGHFSASIAATGPVRLQFAGRALRALEGDIREVEVEFRAGEPVAARLQADGPVSVEPAAYQGLFDAAEASADTPQRGHALSGPTTMNSLR
jgi:hypothetical protein